MSIKDKSWKYADANETRKPGYLARKFARIRAEQKEQAEAKAAPRVVTQIRKGAIK